MSIRTEVQGDGIECRICDLEGRIPEGEGISFLYVIKAWSLDYRFTGWVDVVYTLDGVEQEYALRLSAGHYPFFDRDGLWRWLENPARIAFLEASAPLIVNLLDQEGMFEGEMEGLL